MAQNKKSKNKEVKKEVESIVDTVDIDKINQIIDSSNINDFVLTKKTLTNIAEWALDGKSQFEIAHNLELTPLEWQYLMRICPAIMLVMQHCTAYADIVVAGTLFQTAIGGKTIKKKVPLKVKEYDQDTGKVIGEHYEMVEVEEVTEPNPFLLKYLAENKLSEKFGKGIKNNVGEHRDIINNMTEDERKAFEEMSAK